MIKEELVDKVVDRISELLELAQSIRFDIYTGKNPAKKLEEALYEIELLHVDLFRLYEIFSK